MHSFSKFSNPTKINMDQFNYGIDQLTIQHSLNILKGQLPGNINPSARQKIEKSVANIKNMIDSGETIYGVNTGFGPLCSKIISKEETKKLQSNLLQSHSVGVGEYLSKDIAKLMMILKVNSLAYGYSGITNSTLDRILWFIDQDIIPCVPSQGSVGASGDLAPLAHLFLPLIGLGRVFHKEVEKESMDVLSQFQLSPIELGPKEGLALINGTQFIAAHAVKITEKLHNCLENADIIAAMNLEAMLGSIQPFDPRLHQLRPFSGAVYVAERMRNMLEGSEILKSHEHCERVQDQYSIRCIPQVHGASRDAWLHLKNAVETELNSVTDNPIILDENTSISGGNFHGQPLALPLDYAALAASEIGNISDRRIYFSLEGKIEGLPQLLMKETGLNSGFMIPQYTSAALVSENKSLCFPASADSIPTSLGQEDHVSMGSISARKTLRIIDNLEKILGIELLCASQGFDFRRPLKSTKLLNICHEFVREKIPVAKKDRVFADDINMAIEIIRNKELVELTNRESYDNATAFSKPPYVL